MELFGMPLNRKMVLWLSLQILIIVDIVLITAAMLFSLPEYIANGIKVFDLFVCIILLIEWVMNLYMSKPKTLFLKQKDNWISLIASIPFDVILLEVGPGIGLLRYLRLLKLLRIAVLFTRFFDGFSKFIKKTNLDKILGGVFFTVLFFTLLLWIFGSSYKPFDYFYFVIVTLTTVGYGDVVPKTYNEKVIALMLIFAGIFVFSTITAAISSFLTDRLLSTEDDAIEDKLDNIKEEMNELSKQNQELKSEIKDLKELIEKR